MPCHAMRKVLCCNGRTFAAQLQSCCLQFFSWQAVTRIGASPAEIASFLSNSYGPSWDTAIAQERLVELLSDSAQVRTLTAAIPGRVRKTPLSIDHDGHPPNPSGSSGGPAARLHSLHVVQHVWRCNAPLHCEESLQCKHHLFCGYVRSDKMSTTLPHVAW